MGAIDMGTNKDNIDDIMQTSYKEKHEKSRRLSQEKICYIYLSNRISQEEMNGKTKG